MHLIKIVLGILVLSQVVISEVVRADEEYALGFQGVGRQDAGWSWLPFGRPLRPLLSDPLDLKTGLRKTSRRELEADVGYYRSVAGWKGDWNGEEAVFHTGIEGNAYFNLRKEDSKFPLNSSDGVIGVYAEVVRGHMMYQFRFTHISAHLSDGLALIRNRFVYTREFISLRVAHQWDWVRGYLGYHFLTHTEPEFPRHSGQVGAYAILPFRTFQRVYPYFGFDEKIRNSREGSTLTLSTGLAMLSKYEMPPLRLSINYLVGHDLRGQFYSERRKKLAVGIDLDL